MNFDLLLTSIAVVILYVLCNPVVANTTLLTVIVKQKALNDLYVRRNYYPSHDSDGGIL